MLVICLLFQVGNIADRIYFFQLIKSKPLNHHWLIKKIKKTPSSRIVSNSLFIPLNVKVQVVKTKCSALRFKCKDIILDLIFEKYVIQLFCVR